MKNKKLRNVKIYRPKRKYNKPRYSIAIASGQQIIFYTGKIRIQITNNGYSTAYYRFE